MPPTIAIQPDQFAGRDGRPESSSERWAEYAQRDGYEVRRVDVFAPDILARLADCVGFMWRHGHFSRDRAVARRLLPVLETQLGLCVYPDLATAWHYDDKIAQTYLLDAAGLPTPRTWLFWRRPEAEAFLGAAEFPLVVKLWSGAGSSNVRLVRSPAEGCRLVKRLFEGGVEDLRQLEPQGRAGLIARARAAVHLFLGSPLPPEGDAWERHKNYVLFQEFLPDNAFDTRLTVIGQRAFGFRRFNRPQDFRASGSGRLDFDPQAIDPAMTRLAFRTARALRAQSCAIDGLYRAGAPVIAEISYTYASWAVHDCPGHWRLDNGPDAPLRWVAGGLWPEEAQWQDFRGRLEERLQRRPTR